MSSLNSRSSFSNLQKQLEHTFNLESIILWHTSKFAHFVSFGIVYYASYVFNLKLLEDIPTEGRRIFSSRSDLVRKAWS